MFVHLERSPGRCGFHSIDAALWTTSYTFLPAAPTRITFCGFSFKSVCSGATMFALLIITNLWDARIKQAWRVRICFASSVSVETNEAPCKDSIENLLADRQHSDLRLPSERRLCSPSRNLNSRNVLEMILFLKSSASGWREKRRKNFSLHSAQHFRVESERRRG